MSRGVVGGDADAGVETKTGDAADPEPAISVEGLTKRFGSGEESVLAVDDVSFRIESGSVVGLLGPNGAGKTTTIKSILGMVLPDAGTVRVKGIDIHRNPRRAYHHVDAMLEGARNDYWRLTVMENLRYFSTIKGNHPDGLADRHERLLEQLDLAEKADTAVRELSRGMKQKVSLASVLASDVDVVFLDEPTLGLDVESSLTLRRELRRIVEERNLTAVISSHDMDVIEDVCDRVIIVNDGRVIADDTVSNLVRSFATHAYRFTSPDVSERTLSAVRERFDVTTVDRYDGVTRFEVAADSEEFYALTRLLESEDVTLDAVNTVEPDLEEIFVEVTGAGNAQRPDRRGGEHR